jgi:hypothetical protein
MSGSTRERAAAVIGLMAFHPVLSSLLYWFLTVYTATSNRVHTHISNYRFHEANESTDLLCLAAAGHLSGATRCRCVTVRRRRLTLWEAGLAGWRGETKINTISPNPATPNPQRAS